MARMNFDRVKAGMGFEFLIKPGTIWEIEAKDEAGFSLTLKRLIDGKVVLMRAHDFNYKCKSGALVSSNFSHRN